MPPGGSQDPGRASPGPGGAVIGGNE